MTNHLSARSVLVTGATGFIGSHLTAALLREGAVVHAVTRAANPPSVPGALFHRYDGTTASLFGAVKAAGPEVCFHLASLFRASHNTDEIDPLIDANIRFGTQLLEALTLASPTPPRELVFVNAGTAWQHRGGSAYAPVSLYAATKQAFEDILEHYASSGLKRTTLKLFDTYGPSDRRGKLVSVLLDHVGRTGPLPMSGGEQLIDLLHADDVVAAFVRAAEIASSGSMQPAYSLSAGRSVTIRELVQIVEKISGHPLNVAWGARPYRQFEMFEPWDAGERLPGWEPLVSLEEGIARLFRARA
jgi:nucleoside-diphosphate-sugar epimerase